MREKEWRIGSKAGEEMLGEGARRFQRYSKRLQVERGGYIENSRKKKGTRGRR